MAGVGDGAGCGVDMVRYRTAVRLPLLDLPSGAKRQIWRDRQIQAQAYNWGVAEALKTLRRLQRKLARSRRVNPDGSNRQTALRLLISQTHADVAAVRRDAMHKLTTRLAKTHGVIVIEDLNVKGMMKKSGLPGGRARRRALADAALGEFRRQLTYKTKWYGSELIIADRWFPSSQTCHVCHHRQKIKWAAKWTCGECGSVHDRDDNAAGTWPGMNPTKREVGFRRARGGVAAAGFAHPVSEPSD